MPELEVRWPCPVCLGVKMEKVVLPAAQGTMQLDHCRRCGGMWFELGEIQAVRQVPLEQLWRAVERREGVAAARCHSCHASMARDMDRCPACGERASFDCPSCQQPLLPATHGDLTLDACAACRGVWFDHHGLEALWRRETQRALERARGRGLPAEAGEGGAVLLDAMIFAPDLVFLGAHAAGHMAAASLQGLSHAPEVVGAAGEAAAEAASSVFEIIVEIVAGLF